MAEGGTYDPSGAGTPYNLLFILEMLGPLGWGACGRGRWEIMRLEP